MSEYEKLPFDTEEDRIVEKYRQLCKGDDRDLIGASLGGVEVLIAEIDRLRTELQQHQWRSIESAPMDGTRVLVGRPDEPCKDGSGVIIGGTFEASWDDESQKWLSCVCLNCLDENEVVGPTHWMPLPEPPESDQ